MSLNKFTHIPLLKNDVQLKQKQKKTQRTTFKKKKKRATPRRGKQKRRCPCLENQKKKKKKRQRCPKKKKKGNVEGICVKYIFQHFFLFIFFPNWEDKKRWAQRENFPPYFLSLLFSLLNQTVENVIFHFIFHPLYFHSNQAYP